MIYEICILHTCMYCSFSLLILPFPIFFTKFYLFILKLPVYALEHICPGVDVKVSPSIVGSGNHSGYQACMASTFTC